MTTPTQDYAATLKNGPLPSASDLRDLCTDLHAALVDAPEMIWMSTSWEDMADNLTNAITCAANEPQQEVFDLEKSLNEHEYKEER